MAQYKRPGLKPLENLSLVMDSYMGRVTDRAGNHVSGGPAQNAFSTGKKEPDPLCPLNTTDVPFFLAHVSSVDDDNEGRDSFCKYLPIRINMCMCMFCVGRFW
jgi:hypothetical protein